MSQSDYIKRKKIAVNLREYNEPDAPKESVPVVFSSGQLQAYKEFATINNIEMSVDNMESCVIRNWFLGTNNSFLIWNAKRLDVHHLLFVREQARGLIVLHPTPPLSSTVIRISANRHLDGKC